MAEWKRVEPKKATIWFTCTCGEDQEVDFEGREMYGSTSIEFTCDDCGAELLIYTDVDVRVRDA